MTKLSLTDLRSLGNDPQAFVSTFGDLSEHSPWVAERAAVDGPFSSVRSFYDALVGCVQRASDPEKLALLRAHPELAGREAVAGTLTPASTSEQDRLGLTRLSAEEFARLAALNRRYRESFGFPCIIALRLQTTRESVMQTFEQRLGNSRQTEIATALAQVGEIVRGRLAQRFGLALGGLSTHVLDTANGVPAVGMRFTLSIEREGGWHELKAGETNAQGRGAGLLLSDIDMEACGYRLAFHVGAYFRARGTAPATSPFLDRVPIEFGIADPGQHYHVPLLCGPWSYTTYRGS